MTVAATAVMSGGAGLTASADQSCDPKEVRFWEDANFGGNDVLTTQSYENNWPNWIENKDSAASNHGTTGLGVRVHDYHDYKARIWCIPAAVSWGRLNPQDRGSSHGWGYC
ncbi:peptidase inhibitor family I36 protein [Actinomadura meridiana]|uniref:peptidase inhibitor family I36 protein n=1 Tax=Actinomadura meridiana TaxID=559626 RepID=UPI0031E9221E